MITANSVYLKTMKTFDPVIDKIIEEEITPMFIQTEGMSVKLDCKTLHKESVVIEASYFIKQMHMRGFQVEVGCDDRPCAEPYYKITIPPQE